MQQSIIERMAILEERMAYLERLIGAEPEEPVEEATTAKPFSAPASFNSDADAPQKWMIRVDGKWFQSVWKGVNGKILSLREAPNMAKKFLTQNGAHQIITGSLRLFKNRDVEIVPAPR